MELTPLQKIIIDNHWTTLTLTELTRKVFDDNELDGRSAEGRLIKEYLGDRKAKTSAFIPGERFELTTEQKEFIKSNLNMRPIEIARVLLKNPNIQPLSLPVRTITKYIAEIGGSSHVNSSDIIKEEYRPPLQISQVVNKVNEFARQNISHTNRTNIQTRYMEALRGFLHSPRFLQMINSYVSQKNRDLFESEFVRSVWDKPDLNTDELNLYVNLCHNYVMMVTINRHKDMLDARYEDELNKADSKLSQNLSEMIKAKTDELNKCDKRQSDLIAALNGKRAERLKDQKVNNASVAHLIVWFQEEKNRQTALKWAELEAKEAEEEVDRLMSVDDVKAMVLGLSKSELLNG